MSQFTQLPNEKPFVPYAIDAITVDSTAGGVPLTAANAQGCRRAVIIVETAQLRYTTTSTFTPTATAGMLSQVADVIVLLGPEIQAFKAIRATATNAAITVEYSR